MTRKTRKRSASAAMRGNELLLAPAVMAMRMPLMMAELGAAGQWPTESARAVSEKALAGFEGLVAAQLSLMESATVLWANMMFGRSISILDHSIYERAMTAGAGPSLKAVSANFRRLSSRKI